MMDVVLVHFIRINPAIRISYVRSRPICCVFVSEASISFLCIVFSTVLFMCTRGVREVVLFSNKIVHHPALKKYQTSTLKKYKNFGQLLAQSVTTINKVSKQIFITPADRLTIGSDTTLDSTDRTLPGGLPSPQMWVVRCYDVRTSKPFFNIFGRLNRCYFRTSEPLQKMLDL